MGKAWTHNPDTTNTAAVITIPAMSGECSIEVEHVGFSYNATPAAAQLLTIESPPGTVLQQYFITTAGPGPVPMSGSCIRGAKGQAMVIRLPADASAKGCLNAIERAN